MFDEFYTERLYIRKLEKKDAQFIVELLNTPGWIKFIGARNIHTVTDAETYIEKISLDANCVYWTIMTKEENQPVGILTFIKRSYLEYHDIGFAALPKYHGLGLMKEACSTFISKLLSEHPGRKVLASVFAGNVSSINLLQRLRFKFKREQVIEDKVLQIYSLNN